MEITRSTKLGGEPPLFRYNEIVLVATPRTAKRHKALNLKRELDAELSALTLAGGCIALTICVTVATHDGGEHTGGPIRCRRNDALDETGG